jgi:outer membrane lipoprotein carrier protein
MKKNFLRSICLFLFLNSLMSFVFAETPSDTLTQLLRNMHSMQANFLQTVVDKNGKALQKSTGVMSLQRPSQFRWDVKKPTPQLIVTNGVRLWIYDPDLEQVTIRRLASAAGETPALLLSDEKLSLAKEFNVKAMSNSTPEMQWFLLNPKDDGNMISVIKLAFANNQVREMQIQDHLGHTTLIQFSNVKMNIPLSSSLFLFKAPANIDVIDETKR